MKKNIAIIAAAGAAAAAALAQTDVVWFRFADGLSIGAEPQTITSVKYDADGQNLVAVHDGTQHVISPVNDALPETAFGTTDGSVTLSFSADAPQGVWVENPRGFDDVECAISSAGHATVTTTGTELVTLHVTGTTADGQVKIYGTAPVHIILDGAQITDGSGAPLNIQSTAGAEIELRGASVLADSKKYTTPTGESQKGAVHSAVPLTFSGEGALTLTALCKHGVCCDADVTIAGGSLTVTAAASDGIHCEGFAMTGGAYTSTATAGDGIDAGAGTLSISGGSTDITIDADDVKAVKADGDIAISGGDMTLTVNSAQGKGIKTKGSMTITGGTLHSTTTGEVVVTDGDPSYCTTIKVDGNLDISGGSMEIRASGTANKGISVDGDATFTAGTFDISCSGDGNTYTNVDGDPDTYSSTCITVDGTLNLLGGTYTLSNSGTAGKCIKADTAMVIGTAEGGPTVTAHTSGAKILESSSSGSSTGGMGGPGGMGGGMGGPGGMDNNDYSNPKVVKCDGDLTVNGGSLTLSSSQDGGEALESKATLTINGGDINISTVDDCINASSHIQINGGIVRCVASDNDAIDSNGTITITGGVVIAVGTKTPECGIDCDQNRFTVTGGTIVAVGGDTSSPTASACTQRCVVYSTSVTAGKAITVTAPDGTHILTFTPPTSISSGKMLFSDGGITTGTHTIYTGGSVTGGTQAYDLVIGGSYTPGTQAKTFSPGTSMVTTVSGSSWR